MADKNKKVAGFTYKDFLPANVCPVCATRGGSETDNAKHLEWHEKTDTLVKE